MSKDDKGQGLKLLGVPDIRKPSNFKPCPLSSLLIWSEKLLVSVYRPIEIGSIQIVPFLSRLYNSMPDTDIILRITKEKTNNNTGNENIGILDNVNGNANEENENTTSKDKSWFLQLDNCEVQENHYDIR